MDIAGNFEKFDYAAVLLGLAMLAPGFLLLFVRSRYVTGRIPSLSSAAVEYIIASSLYYTVSGPIFFYLAYYNWFSVLVLVFFGPLTIGVFLGGLVQWEWPKKLGGCLSLNPVTPYPTGWDKAFGSLKGPVWMIIHTKDLGVIYGRFGELSNASSDLSVRDIFIEEVRGTDFENVGESDEIKGMWIREDQIRAIEIANDREIDDE